MATPHFQFNPGTTGGSRLRNVSQAGEAFLDALTKEIATMGTLCEGGDPNQTANFGATYLAYYGFSTAAEAQASYNECNSAFLKVNTDASVSSVMSAIKNLANKHR